VRRGGGPGDRRQVEGDWILVVLGNRDGVDELEHLYRVSARWLAPLVPHV
jgi:hypothetical protein